ncbi:MAG: hypothetical protein JWO38_7771 [Gemmataceae bacterium]|nr:hypothetical protein [Gemmataceae bacterium]
MNRLPILALVVALAALGGCSKDESPATVKSLRSRGLKDTNTEGPNLKAPPKPAQAPP